LWLMGLVILACQSCITSPLLALFRLYTLWESFPLQSRGLPPQPPSVSSNPKMVCIYIQRPPARSDVASTFPVRREQGYSVCCARSEHTTIEAKNTSIPLCYIIDRSKSIVFLLNHSAQDANTRCLRHLDVAWARVLPVYECCVARLRLQIRDSRGSACTHGLTRDHRAIEADNMRLFSSPAVSR
jgi:hypothetical protein